MAVNKKFKGDKGFVIEEGTHVGLFLGLVHLGIQRGEFEGVVSYKDQVLIKFELPDVLSDKGTPLTLSKRVTNSSHSKAELMKAVKALSGNSNVDEGVDFEELVGSPVMLEVGHSKSGGAKIVGYMPVPAALKKTIKPLMGEPVLLFDVEKISDKELEKMPEWLRKVINERSGNEPETNEDVNY